MINMTIFVWAGTTSFFNNLKSIGALLSFQDNPSAYTKYQSIKSMGVEVESAGSAPVNAINPLMVEAMEEKGIDMAFRRPKSIHEATINWIPDQIVSMGCGDSCPMYPGVKNVVWDLPDPAGRPIDFMRGVRDEIEKRIKELVASEGFDQRK